MAVLAALAAPAAARAAGIEAVGVLGNSGVAGPALVRAAGGGPSGVAADAGLTLWTSGGDAVNRLALDGRCLERFPLGPAGTRIVGQVFAVLGGRLYFVADVPGKGPVLMALPMRPGAAAAPVEAALPASASPDPPYALAARPLGGRLVMAARVKGEAERPVHVFTVDPAGGAVAPLARLDGPGVYGLAVDEARGVVYVGTGVLSAFHADGRPVEGFPVACMKTPAIPPQFRGRLSLAGGALWDTAWYGFLSRHNLAGEGDPGRVIEWSHDLDYPSQMLALAEGGGPRQPLVVTCAESDAFYFAVWRGADRDFSLVRRLGCLPVITSVGLSRDGWATVGTRRTQLLWRWDDAADAVPARADIHMAVTPVHFAPDGVFALGGQYHLDERMNAEGYVPTLFPYKPGNRNEASRGPRPPFKRPVGLSVQPGAGRVGLFVTDAETRGLWRTTTSADRPMDLDAAGWQPVKIAGDPPAAPSDVVALADGRLLVADAGAVLLLVPEGDAYRTAWRMDRWGDGPAQRFGPALRLAADGPWMLVSDTRRHRLVWIDWTDRRVLGEFGRADEAGDDLRHLASPGQVALCGDRALAADAGNQRVLRLVLRP